MIRSSLAVVAGYLVFSLSAVLFFRFTGNDPAVWPGIQVALLGSLVGIIFAAAAGVITVTLAPRKPMLHATVLAGLMAVGAAGSAAAQWGDASLWSQIETILVFAPAGLAGAYYRYRRAQPR